MVMFQSNQVARPTGSHPNIDSGTSKSLALIGNGLYNDIDVSFVHPTASNVNLPESSDDKNYMSTPSTLISECIKETGKWVKCRQENIDVPTWHAFNARKISDPSVQTTIGYMPMLDAPATDFSTVYKVLKILGHSTTHLGQKYSVIFMDQAMYAKAMEIKLANLDIFPKCVIMMGGFHIHMNFLAAIGTVMSSLGWTDIFLGANIFNKSVVSNLLDAKPYSICLDAHIALYEALCILRSKSVEGNLIDEGSALCKIWSLYIYLVDLCLCQLYAERTGNWQMYLQTLTALIPVFFATNRQNYARWLTVHVHEMSELETKVPSVFHEFSKGNFAVKRSIRKFSAVPPDMALEQTINRDVKCQGGLIGKTLKDGARQRWFLTAHTKATVSAGLDEMCGEGGMPTLKSDDHHSDNKYATEKSTEWPQKILALLREGSKNPFTAHKGKTDEIHNIITGHTLSAEDSSKILSTLQLGSNAHFKFVTERLVRQEGKIKDRIPRLKIPYSFHAKKAKPVNDLKALSNTAQAQISLLSRAVIGTGNDINVSEVLDSLEAFPPSISNHDGSFTKGDKSQLNHVLLNEIKSVDCQKYFTDNDTQRETTVLIVDGMALVHKIKPSYSMCITFDAYASELFKRILSDMRHKGAIRSDIIFDRYKDDSIKSSERQRRSQGKFFPRITISDRKTKVPTDWEGFLSTEENKSQLISFLEEEWGDSVIRELIALDETVVFCGPEKTCMLNHCGVTIPQQLQCNHEEADTIIILHLKTLSSVYKNVTVICDDTDVMALLVHFTYKWDISGLAVRLFTKQVYISINALTDKLGKLCQNILGLHAITGCDTVSSMWGVSKAKAFKHQIDSLRHVGDITTTDTDLYPFIYALYGAKEFQGDLNQLRFKLLAEYGRTGKQLPPDNDNFKLHYSRTGIQTKIWKQAELAIIDHPAPESHGWEHVPGRGYIPRYSNPAGNPSAKILVSCKCKTCCLSHRCQCRRGATKCSDLCGCRECSN